MSILGDVLGYVGAGRAAKSVSDANIAAEHGVLGAGSDAENRIDTALAGANTNVNAAGSNATDVLGGIYDKQSAALQPYQQAGAAGTTALNSGVQQLADYAASKPTFSFNPTDLQNDPGYQFQLKQGQDAITNSLSAGGVGNSGAALKELTQYGQGLAGTYYNDAFNRALNTFNTNQNTTLANLSALTGAGATESGVGLAGAGLQQQANTQQGNLMAELPVSVQQYLASLNLGGNETAGQEGMTAAQQAGNFAVGAGQAHGAGILAQYNNLANLGNDVGSLAAGFMG